MPIVFFSYSHADEALRDQIDKQLAMLKRQGVIETWHDRRIGAGEELDRAIDENLERSDIILLLVSHDFLASEYCYGREMLRAMERHEEGTAIVIPVILRACEWQHAPFGKLMATPPDGKPITQWQDRDQALLEVAKSVRAAALRRGAPVASKTSTLAPTVVLEEFEAGPRSSNLRLAKQFTERDKDAFRVEAFEYISRFFENSLAELEKRNDGIEGTFRRIDANRFTASIYRQGKAVTRCTVFMGGGYFGNGINYAHGETDTSNSMNESLSIEADDQSLFLRSMGMGMSGRRDEHLTLEGGAELYWDRFIEQLQRS